MKPTHADLVAAIVASSSTRRDPAAVRKSAERTARAILGSWPPDPPPDVPDRPLRPGELEVLERGASYMSHRTAIIDRMEVATLPIRVQVLPQSNGAVEVRVDPRIGGTPGLVIEQVRASGLQVILNIAPD